MPLKMQIDEIPVLNLTSMIDVMFLLILFFVVGTKFIDPERSMDVKLPEVRDRGALSPAPERKVINLSETGQITIDQKNVSLPELEARLRDARGQYNDLGVLVRGDRASRLQAVADVLQVCKQAGVNELGISVKLER